MLKQWRQIDISAGEGRKNKPLLHSQVHCHWLAGFILITVTANLLPSSLILCWQARWFYVRNKRAVTVEIATSIFQ